MSINKTPNDLMGQSLAADPKGMSALSARIAQDPKGAIREVSQQFEAMFMNNLLKTMRETHFDDEDQSSEMQTYRGLLDQQLVQSLTSGSGMGLSKVLERQISQLAHVEDDANPVLPTSQVNGSLPVSSRLLRAYQDMQSLGARRAQGLAASDAASEAASAGQDSSESGVTSGNARSFVQTLLPHVGGDDFVLLMQSSDWASRLTSVLAAFDLAVAEYFSPEHVDAQGFHLPDRRGEMTFFPLTSLSIGVLKVLPGYYRSYLEIASAAAEAKKMAKKQQGSSLFVERRQLAARDAGYASAALSDRE